MHVCISIHIYVSGDMAPEIGLVCIHRGAGGGGEEGRRVGGGKECRVDGKRGWGRGGSETRTNNVRGG